jgi:threonine/homoserine/homoserine lactone efflux protein
MLFSSNTPPFAIATNQSMIESFLSAFVLTASSPLTIVFWTGVFGTKAAELNLDKSKLLVFGLSAVFPPLFFSVFPQ